MVHRDFGSCNSRSLTIILSQGRKLLDLFVLPFPNCLLRWPTCTLPRTDSSPAVPSGRSPLHDWSQHFLFILDESTTLVPLLTPSPIRPSLLSIRCRVVVLLSHLPCFQRLLLLPSILFLFRPRLEYLPRNLKSEMREKCCATLQLKRKKEWVKKILYDRKFLQRLCTLRERSNPFIKYHLDKIVTPSSNVSENTRTWGDITT